MGKRGPQPKGEYAGKSQVFSTRIRPDLRAYLEEASQANGRSLSQEIEHRLRRTFIEDERIADAFGDRQNYLLMRMAALAIRSRGWNPDNPDANWLDDPFAFDQAIRTLNEVLEAIRPPGDIPKLEDEALDTLAEHAPAMTAAEGWRKVQEADTALPLHEGTNLDHQLGILKGELGDAAMRPTIFSGTADELRKKADEIQRAEESGQAVNHDERQRSPNQSKEQDDGTR